MTEDSNGNGGLARCGYCGAAVIWRRHVRTQGRAPLDPEPRADGNCIMVAATMYRVLRKGETLPADVPRFVNHHFTCPNLPQGRKTR